VVGTATLPILSEGVEISYGRRAPLYAVVIPASTAIVTTAPPIPLRDRQGTAGRLFSPARPTHTDTSTLEISHFRSRSSDATPGHSDTKNHPGQGFLPRLLTQASEMRTDHRH
jgi:hypothetical protein